MVAFRLKSCYVFCLKMLSDWCHDHSELAEIKFLLEMSYQD
jgi:hypothetical protein